MPEDITPEENVEASPENTPETETPVSEPTNIENQSSEETPVESEPTEPAVEQPALVTPQVPGSVSQDGPTARNDLVTVGQLIENVLSHLDQNRSIHHDVTELENKLKDARQWLATELDVPLTTFGNPAAS